MQSQMINLWDVPSDERSIVRTCREKNVTHLNDDGEAPHRPAYVVHGDEALGIRELECTRQECRAEVELEIDRGCLCFGQCQLDDLHEQTKNFKVLLAHLLFK